MRPNCICPFFFFHEDFGKWTEARIAAAPSRKNQIVSSSAKYLGIAPSEFAALETITGGVASELRALSDEAHIYVQSSLKAKGDVDHKKLVSYAARRNAIIQSGIAKMKNALSPESWQSLYSYINNQHRQHVSVNPSTAKKTVP
jgi:hypothetical protein